MSTPGLRRGLVAVATALAMGILDTACGAAQSPDSSGTTNLTSGSCFSRGTQCTENGDCCTLWCANGVCARREP